jgi:signal transduction histidine kinase/ActR/RegA family two-component response regulator
MQWTGAATDAAPFAAEQLQSNVSRIRTASVIALAVHALFMAVFGFGAPGAGGPDVPTWRLEVVAVHGIMFVLAALFALISRIPERFPAMTRALPLVLLHGYLLMGAALAAVDQRFTTEVSAFLIVTLAAPLVVRVSVKAIVVSMFVAVSAFALGQYVMQPDPLVCMSNIANGFAVGVVGALLSGIFSRHHFHEYRQRMVIERQRQELSAALDEAQRASRAKSVFLATMSHEIRTPMTGVLGVADLLAQTPLSPSQRELLQTIQESGQSLVGLINDLLDMSKAEAGRLSVEAHPFDFRDEVTSVVRLFEARAKEKGLSLEVRWDDTPPVLRGDGLRVRQIVSNLVANALKFTTMGRVTLVVRVVPLGTACRVELAVHDTGPGISEEGLSRLFRPFAQADEHITHTYGGTGLGLVISRQLAEALGGTVRATSTPGVGSTFTLEVTLPVAAPGEPSVPRAPPSATPSHAPMKGRVLVVDDNVINQRVAQGVLRQLGLEVEVAGDGAGAQALLEARPFDAVLTDLHMPGVDGLALVRWVRAHAGALARLPVIVLTADTNAAERASCIEAGANEVMAKPFRAADLEMCLRQQAATLSAA